MRAVSLRLAALGLALAAGTAAAQQYPTRNITMLVPYAAGGPTDTVARVVAQAMSKPLGQTVVVENRPSAGGNDVPMTLIANAKVPAKNFQEFLSYLKANRDKVTYANAGIGAASHLCGMLFMSAVDLDILTVPYKGTAPAMNDLLGGQVTFMCDQTTNTTSQIKSGKVKVYGVTSAKRVPSLPDVPTLQEQGLKGFEVGIWHALYGPKGMPKAAQDKLVAALQETVKDETVKKRFADLGATTFPPEKATPAALEAHLKQEIDKWAPLIKKAGQFAD